LEKSKAPAGRRALITGVTGQDGAYLARLLLVEVDPSLYRRAEIDAVLGSPQRAKAKLGWTPQTSLEQLVAMMVDADLRRVSEGSLA
jgi:GDP-D-mannose dehydratase